MLDPKELRNAFGGFATGVTVLSTVSENKSVHAMTANAFMSGSLDPALLVVSISKNAKMCAHLQYSKKLGVSILAENQEQECYHFAGKPNENLKIEFNYHVEIPFLSHAKSHFACVVVHEYECGDHILFVGEILDFNNQIELKPLIFFQGKTKQIN